ncbi:hypothetical protein EC912_106170 [Luteibacter rhizovicinus]|uniref:Coagulation factor 5/8 type domain-containing protein n=1 Tax=Luteibacter rhizovicinus TaxID=242606 RepID=A0A4R3YKV6_9GAMM|nr:discoidin domain-containing protein [Luteibacter rhizovicinus]TCV92831.1 hypothetical protein EC912_106170 [Luteibacter rhizovicinus]
MLLRSILATAALTAGCLLPCAYAQTDARLLDGFDRAANWTVGHTDDVSATLRQDGGSLCLDFDFNGVSGSASLKRELPIDYPGNFALSFDVRGSMSPNTLQLKLIDDSGDNVWWYQRPAFVPTKDWQHIEVRRKDIEFAWGPTKDRVLTKTAAVEFMIYAEKAGKGRVCFDNLRLKPLPPEPANAAPSTAAATPPKVYFQAQAKKVRRGLYPRGFSGEQSYWTLVGVDGGSAESALISEDGAIEVNKGGFSIEPFVLDNGKLVTWADVRASQSLLDGYLPIPSVQWKTGALGLETTVFAQGEAGRSELVMRYRVSNDGDAARDVTLALMARPFQVNPPTQFLNSPGGTSPIHDFAWDGKKLTVNGVHVVVPLQKTDDFVASRNTDGSLPERIAAGQHPSVAKLHDDLGFAQGAFLYRLHVPAKGHVDLGLVVPSISSAHVDVPANTAMWLESRLDAIASTWREKLNRVSIEAPTAAQPIVDTMRSGVAQILMSRNGPALQPGTRSYGRTWVRDGAMMLEGLLRTGHADVAGEFVDWYAPHQFSNGKVPCCVDARGSDPVPENDSHGELIFSVAELYRYTHNREQLTALWPHVERAVAYMDKLRLSERTDAQRNGPLYGLMPASISHEGYSAKPMHSYWDDFWAMKGYDDAVDLAATLGKTGDAKRMGESRDTFRTDLHASIAAAVKEKGIDFIPGSAELGDFDATSTTIAISPGDEQTRLPADLVQGTFERYWQGFVARRDGKTAWDDYTPYELRTVATFVRLGWRDRVQELLAFFFADRRPAAWNQWAEVVGRDPRKPRFVGDMPHAWIASDYVRSALDLFAYERASDHAMVLGAGVPMTWLDGKGIAVRDMRTPYGKLGYTLRREDGKVVLTITGDANPPGGYVLALPKGEVRVAKSATHLDVRL